MSKISDAFSHIFGFHVKEGQWNRYLAPLDKEGEPTRKHMTEMLFAICEEIEALRADLDAFVITYASKTDKKRDAQKPL